MEEFTRGIEQVCFFQRLLVSEFRWDAAMVRFDQTVREHNVFDSPCSQMGKDGDGERHEWGSYSQSSP